MQTNQATIKLECEKIKISELMQILQNVENGIKSKTTGESEIYIQEVAKGSMIFDIIQIIPAVLPFVENINSVVLILLKRSINIKRYLRVKTQNLYKRMISQSLKILEV